MGAVRTMVRSTSAPWHSEFTSQCIQLSFVAFVTVVSYGYHYFCSLHIFIISRPQIFYYRTVGNSIETLKEIRTAYNRITHASNLTRI
jgi:hypothetical protein